MSTKTTIKTLGDYRDQRVLENAREIVRERKQNLRAAVKSLRRAQKAAHQYGGEMHAELVTTRLQRVIDLQSLCGYPVYEAAGELPL